MIAERYSSSDGVFHLSLPKSVLEELRGHCKRAGKLETGGILVGHYADRLSRVVVSAASGPPEGSRATRWSFVRTVGKLQAWLDSLWRRKADYYVGEWHYHPGASASPSGVDVAQMRAIARDEKYACPEPLLIILGGDPRAEHWLSATIYTAKLAIELSPDE